MCDRFLAYQFPHHEDEEPLQAVLSVGGRILVGSYLALPCDTAWSGCTEHFQERLGEKWNYGRLQGQTGPLSLVQKYPGLALIGRELQSVEIFHGDDTPALLCHKEPAQ